MSSNETRQFKTFQVDEKSLNEFYLDEASANFKGQLTPGKQIWWADGEDGARQYAKNSAAIDAFSAWNTKRKEAKSKHKEYVKLKTDQPGRDATILTVPGENTTSLLGK